MSTPQFHTPHHEGLDLAPARLNLPNSYADVTRCDLTATAQGEVVVTDLPTVELALPPQPGRRTGSPQTGATSSPLSSSR